MILFYYSFFLVDCQSCAVLWHKNSFPKSSKDKTFSHFLSLSSQYKSLEFTNSRLFGLYFYVLIWWPNLYFFILLTEKGILFMTSIDKLEKLFSHLFREFQSDFQHKSLCFEKSILYNIYSYKYRMHLNCNQSRRWRMVCTPNAMTDEKWL